VRIGIAYQFMPTSDKWRWLDGFSAIFGFRDVTAIGMRFQTLGALEAAPERRSNHGGKGQTRRRHRACTCSAARASLVVVLIAGVEAETLAG
jgi:hypothetical protein